MVAVAAELVVARFGTAVDVVGTAAARLFSTCLRGLVEVEQIMHIVDVLRITRAAGWPIVYYEAAIIVPA